MKVVGGLYLNTPKGQPSLGSLVLHFSTCLSGPLDFLRTGGVPQENSQQLAHTVAHKAQFEKQKWIQNLVCDSDDLPV